VTPSADLLPDASESRDAPPRLHPPSVRRA